MILYTPLSETDIFPTDPAAYEKRKFITHEGRSLYVEQTTDGSYQLLQLLSTDPQDFLKITYQPGTFFTR